MAVRPNEPDLYVQPSRAAQMHAAYLLVGCMRLMLTELELIAADLDSDIVSSVVHKVRTDIDWLGTVLVHERREDV